MRGIFEETCSKFHISETFERFEHFARSALHREFTKL